jgi:hypothetical protein
VTRPLSSTHEAATCPSARCREGALLIGIIGADGRLRYLGQPAEIDRDFVAAAQVGRAPESRFRFSELCARDGCKHWLENRCQLAERLSAGSASLPQSADGLPQCGIRRSCTWFAQEGADACAVCPVVVRTKS